MHKPSKIFRTSDSQIWKYDVSRLFPSFSFVLKCFGDKYGVRGSIFSRCCGISENVPQRIAIDQESWIRHLGIIKTHKINRNILKNKEKHDNSSLFVRILGPIRFRFWAASWHFKCQSMSVAPTIPHDDPPDHLDDHPNQLHLDDHRKIIGKSWEIIASHRKNVVFLFVFAFLGFKPKLVN